VRGPVLRTGVDFDGQWCLVQNIEAPATHRRTGANGHRPVEPGGWGLTARFATVNRSVSESPCSGRNINDLGSGTADAPRKCATKERK
jgi:hypothetical protein